MTSFYMGCDSGDYLDLQSMQNLGISRWQWGPKHGKQSSHPFGISIVIRRQQKSAILNNKSWVLHSFCVCLVNNLGSNLHKLFSDPVQTAPAFVLLLTHSHLAFELISNCRTVTAIVGTTPGND